eukprot:GILK01001381.1.p1 GENE.GILK01001381.1~~GILK01001381.1.p1  ORF type:complete len:310 (+),score=72.83 GILK01001381.1:105-1034(+)
MASMSASARPQVGQIRSLTSTFIKMRGDIRAKKHRFRPTRVVSDPSKSLLEEREMTDIEMQRHTLPPLWVDLMDAARDDISRVKEKMLQLTKAQKKRMLVKFDEDHRDETDIELITAEATKLFKSCEAKVHRIATLQGSDKDLAIRKNIQRALATQLQELSLTFRKSQKEYMSKLKRHKDGVDDLLLDAEEKMPELSEVDKGFTEAQMAQLDSMHQVAMERDEEIQKIAQSVQDLSVIFKELAVLVVDQGTILDRIDYNIEQVLVKTKEGNIELGKAEEHQKAARATKCILLLIVLIFLMVIILIFKNR